MEIRVLHTGDEPGLAESTTAFLEGGDDRITVETATDAKEGLERLGENGYDCVVSEYDIPGKDGIWFLEEVRKGYPEVPFILFTDKGNEEVASEAVSAGVTDYIQKGYGSEAHELLANSIKKEVRVRRDAKKIARQDELMRLTEVSGNTGGFELDVETGRLLLTDGARHLIDAPEDEQFHLEDGIELCHPEERDRIREVLEGVIETREEAKGTFRAVMGEREHLWDVKVTPVTENGEVRKVRGVVNDITEKREREREIEQVETVFESAQDSLFLIDVGEDFTIERVNPAYEKTIGLSAEDVLGKELNDILDEETGDYIEMKYTECAENREALAYEEKGQVDGELTHWETSIVPVVLDGEVEYIAGSTRDVTERKRREEDLRQYKRLTEASSDVILHLDEYGNLLYRKPGTEKLSGYEPGVDVGENVLDYVHPEDRGRVTERFVEVINNPETGADGWELRVETDEGGYVWAEAATTDQTDTELGGVVVSLRDITERKNRERELERYEAFVENSNDMITHMDTDGNVLYLSPAAERAMGRDTEARRGEGGFEYVHPEDRDGMDEEFRDLIEDPENETKEVVYRSQREDGEYIWLETVGVDMTDTDVGGVIANSRDVTERERRKERLRRQKERLDNFAGVVSHDLRNPLSVAKGRLELAQNDCDSEHLDHVDGALDRMETLIDDVLTLAREGSDVGEMEVIETEEFFEDCRRNVDTGDTTVVARVGSRIEADPRRLKQLCENLLRNAVEHGGDDMTVTIGELEDGNGFYIADDGKGIPEQRREEVFEAGHTSSEDGTGFGLSIVEEIVTAHGWDIGVTESEAGGARFEVSGVEVLETA